MADDTKEFDPFATESGLKDDYDMTIEECWFGQHDAYGDTAIFFVKGVADDGDEVENRWPCGPDWASYDGGETVEHPKGERKGFNNNVKYAQLIKAAMECGAEEELRKRSLAGPKTESGVPLGPRAAELWKGLRFHWNAKTETIGPFKDKETGEMIKRDVTVIVPTAFLGVGDSTTAPSANASTGTESAPSTPATTTNGTGAVDPALMGKLTIAAKQAGDYNAFLDAALGIDGVAADSDLMGKIADEAFYTSLKG